MNKRRPKAGEFAPVRRPEGPRVDDRGAGSYEPSVYADQTGQYLPDFEVVGLLEYPLVIDVKGAVTADEMPAIRRGMSRVWSSLPNAGLAVWTGAAITEGAPFEIVRPGGASMSLEDFRLRPAADATT